MTTNEDCKILGIIEAVASSNEFLEESFHTAKPTPSLNPANALAPVS